MQQLHHIDSTKTTPRRRVVAGEQLINTVRVSAPREEEACSERRHTVTLPDYQLSGSNPLEPPLKQILLESK